MKRFLITGTGRSGTKWCATALRIAGVYCGHEQVFATAMLPQHHEPHWGRLVGDSSLAAMPYMEELPNVTKVLVVRHPLDFVSSMLKVGPLLDGGQPAGLKEYLTVTFPDVMTAENEVEAALRYWLHWNRAALPQAQAVLRIEDLTVAALLAAVGREALWDSYPLGSINQANNFTQGVFDDGDAPTELLDDVWEFATSIGYNHQETK
jgi:hypothetical protein